MGFFFLNKCNLQSYRHTNCVALQSKDLIHDKMLKETFSFHKNLAYEKVPVQSHSSFTVAGLFQ
jgi:hypothetical protein